MHWLARAIGKTWTGICKLEHHLSKSHIAHYSILPAQGLAACDLFSGETRIVFQRKTTWNFSDHCWYNSNVNHFSSFFIQLKAEHKICLLWFGQKKNPSHWHMSGCSFPFLQPPCCGRLNQVREPGTRSTNNLHAEVGFCFTVQYTSLNFIQNLVLICSTLKSIWLSLGGKESVASRYQ